MQSSGVGDLAVNVWSWTSSQQDDTLALSSYRKHWWDAENSFGWNKNISTPWAYSLRELYNSSLLELHQNEQCLRLRAILEDSDEDIQEKVTQALADFFAWQVDFKKINKSIYDKIYRINSFYMTIRKVPRDSLVHFLKESNENKSSNAISNPNWSSTM